MGKNKNKKRIKTDEGGLVYSTNKEVMNSLFEGLGNLLDNESDDESSKGKAILRLRMEKKGRGGKTVTIVECENLGNKITSALLSEIKKHFATGGSLKGNEIIIQGDMKEKLRTFLQEKGYAVKG